MIKRKMKTISKKASDEISKQIETETQKMPKSLPEENLKYIVSTGSTLLNLAILGGSYE